MCKRLFKPFILGSFILFLASCAKENTDPEDPNNGGSTPAQNADFRWTINGVTTIADSAVCYAQFTTLFAYKSGTYTTVEINLSDVVPANYIISSTSGNELKYVSSNANLSATNGTVIISSGTGSKLNGSFDAKFNNTAISNINGTFSNVPIR